ncbi:deaminase domain-containing protein [Nucisporomicrobium flavum]|uniref:deaminase domain-containing protein n=1 Tax=Nucisporomicrobium flavum TaxID=2785915 RepID=UPI003C2B895F
MLAARTPWRRPVAAPLALVLIATMAAQAMPESAAAVPATPKGKDVTGVKVHAVTTKPKPSWTAAGRELTSADLAPTKSVTAAHVVDLTAAGDAGRRVADLPVSVAPAPSPAGRSAAARVTKVKLSVEDGTRRHLSGVVVKLSRADGVKAPGSAAVTIDYRTLARHFSPDAISRLRLIDADSGRPIAARNDTAAGTLSSTVNLAAAGMTTLAVEPAAQGDNGDYTATSLSSASTWQVSQQTGAFTWNYPFKLPPAIGTFAPSVGLSYNSGSIDGRTAGTNTQGSWAGDGWDIWPGYVERSYRACSDDHDTKEKKDPNNADVQGGDLCYFDDNATLSFNGSAVELVKVASSDSGNGDDLVLYRGSADDGSTVEMIRDGRSNGDTDGTYWRQTTTDGTRYYYGRSSASAFTVPVYSNHPDDPGYAKDFADSRHNRAWRWNLDYAVDVNGNTITYSYTSEPGAYAREGDKDKRTTYDRGGYLSRIEYGSRTDDPSTAHPVARVDFTIDDRCLGTCFNDDKKPIAAAFPDTPWDQYCDAAPCKTQYSPTFWTSKRLTDITTKIYSGTDDVYTPVDTWHLEHVYLSAGGNEGSPMWLKSIQHKGLTTSAGGPAVTDPATVFDPNADLMPNRVDGPQDGHSSLYRSRISVVTTESGAQIGVTYSDLDCQRANLPKPWSNTKRCFPQYYGAEGETPKLDWFHKYVVDRLDVYDNTGGFVHEQTNFKYLDTPAWAYDDSPLTKPKKRTWGDYRGYGHVEVRKGLENEVQSATEYRYFRGMDGDEQPNNNGDLPPTGTPRSVVVEDSLHNKITDHESFSGTLREELVKNGVDGDWISGTLTTPEHFDATATQGSLHAWPTHTKSTRTRFKLADGSTRWTTEETTYDDDNFPTKVDDRGDDGTAADDRCTTLEYARNRDALILGKVKRTLVVGLRCSATSTNADILSDTRTLYDNPKTYGAQPTRGLPVVIQQLDHWDGDTPKFVTVSTTEYDKYGRTKSVSDALGRTTTTTFTPPTGGPVRESATTDPMGDTVTSTLDPALGVPLKTVDANGATASKVYDGDGRLLAFWAPGRAQATYPNAPNARFSYQLSNNASTNVTTEVLTGYAGTVYRKSIALYDGLLRERQTQTQTVNGGRAITDTIYNSRGLVDWASVAYYDATNAPPMPKLVTPDGRPEVPAQTTNVYDGANRLTDAIFMKSQTEQWRTHTSYNGQKTSVTPPKGGTATTTITDAQGKIVELRQYKDPKNVGSDTAGTYDKAIYGWNRKGLQSKVVDPAGNTWTYDYDLQGRVISAKDPDNGETKSTYYDNGQLQTVQTADRTVAYTYDDRGRKTSMRQNSINGPTIAEWKYDSLPNGRGKLAKSTRFEPPGSTNAYVSAIAGYDEAERPTGITITVPSSETGLCVGEAATPCSYTVGTTYRANGDPWRTRLPAVAKLPKESVETSYNSIGLVDGLMGILDAGNELYADEDFNQLDQLIEQRLGLDVNKVTLVTGVDEQTARRTSFSATPYGKADIYHLTYGYDDIGNVLNITDRPDGGQSAEAQCFTYDYLRRMTHAWTPASLDCGPSPSVPTLGGPAKYWHSYGFDAAGNRKTETIHGTADTIRTYAYPASGGAAGSKPHAVSSVVTASGTSATATRTENYKYSSTGNLTCRPAGTVDNVCPGGSATAKESQTLSWTDDGKLAKSTDKTGDTTFIYDADGNRLIRKDPAGATLYLPGGTEVRKPKTGDAVGTRYYSVSGSTVAVRTPSGVTWMVTDHHGTGSATVSNDGKQSVNRQRTLPYGNNRGTNPTAWVGDKGFVGGTKDNTGLTHLGAREYDPALGRFISVDPMMDLADPTQWNGYGYANNSPVTASDANGLMCTRSYQASGCGAPLAPTPATGGGTSNGGNGSTGGTGGSGNGGTGSSTGGGTNAPPSCGSANSCESQALRASLAKRLAIIATIQDRSTKLGAACLIREDLCVGYLRDLGDPSSDYLRISVSLFCGQAEACMADYGYASPMAPHLGSALTPLAGDTIMMAFIPGGPALRLTEGVAGEGASVGANIAAEQAAAHGLRPEQVAADYRANPKNGVAGRRNVAVAQHDIDGVIGQRIGVSGERDYPGSVPAPASRAFNPGQRPFDSENKILEHYAANLNKDAKGTINLYSEREPCPSCSSVIDQFRETFPGIQVNVTWGR